MFNQVILIGNIVADPELRYTPTGTPVCGFRLAVNKRWKNENGESQEKTTWVSVTAWRKTAELVGQYCKKGMLVQITGELEEARAFTDKQGANRASTEVTASNVLFLSKIENGSGSENGNSQKRWEKASSDVGDGENIPF